MYLKRLHRYNDRLNNVVTFLDDVGMAEAKRADAEIAAGKYKGPLHGIPWGAKDIISVRGYKTTWGSPAFKDQSFDYDASVVEMLRDAGAAIAKLHGWLARATTGSAARPRTRGISRKVRAIVGGLRRPRLPGASVSASAPRRADRLSVRPRAAD